MVELLVSTVVASALLAGLIAAAVSIQRSILATSQFVANTTGQSRLIDYVAQDLRRAVRVGTLVGGAITPLRTQKNFLVSTTDILAVDVPDYYASNAPDNRAGSSYKTTRYPRTALNLQPAFNASPVAALRGVVPWSEAATVVNQRYVTRFAPVSAGDGTVQVRYYKAPRTVADSRISFFRAEYPSGASTPSEVREIADCVSDKVADTTLSISALSGGVGFRIESAFTPRNSSAATFTGVPTAWLEVTLRNPRRD